ncbi:G-protein-coupled receptor family 3 protein 5 [Heterostelium album PN500]|uniref:sn-1-specific diacylglycerol lipase n=1 Tax=Heterostelium pallidum (strain ATCC 26659 / Pp 5 / PN500) TaxID=670386 RepID=D3B5E6_HETP5|nr:G-protein-coupled receptor family 3 protein 5 [Heterostelium album PN500]EFA83094.1 G-protein-coupled receptor family 3 protein 5 [Heterostelium album PN500]|eukprot:XP_020435211.1 G-protein-coupled receptor family 3 protein 5 [Heterostelium album PN500]
MINNSYTSCLRQLIVLALSITVIYSTIANAQTEQEYFDNIDRMLSCNSSQPASEQIRIGMIMPQGDPEYYQYRYTSNLMMIQYLSIFQGFGKTLCRIDIPEYDQLVLDSFDLANGVAGKYDKVHAVIGPAYSSSGTTASLILGAYGVPNIGFFASAAALSNSGTYPAYNRVFPSDDYQVKAILELVKHYGWTRISCVHTREDYGNGGATILSQRAALQGITVDTIQAVEPIGSTSPSEADYDMIFNNLEDARARIIVTYAIFPQDCIGLWNHSLRHNYLEKGILWIVTDGCAEMVDVNPDYQGIISFFPNYNSNGYANLVKNVTSYKLLLQDSLQSEVGKIFYKGAAFSSDATEALMIAFKNILTTNRNADLLDRAMVLEQLRSVSFQGYSGPVELDANTGDRKNPVFVISNYIKNNGTYSFVNVASVALQDEESVVTFKRPIEFMGGTFDPPSDHKVVKFSVPLNSALGAVTGVCIILVLFIGITIVIQWRKFRYSSPLFCCLIILGSLFGFISILTLLPEPNDALCTSFPWLLGYGYVIMFGTLFTKTWRTWRLFANARKFKIIKISNKMIFSVVGAFLLIESAFLVIWTIVDRPKVSAEPIYRNGEAQNQCVTDSLAWWYVFCLSKVFYVIVGVFLAYKTRDVVDSLNESKPISMALYNMVFVMLVAIPIGFLLTDYPTAVIVIEVVAILLAFTATVGLLFLPKVWLIVSGQQKSIDTRDSSSNSYHSEMQTRPSHSSSGNNNSNNNNNSSSNGTKQSSMRVRDSDKIQNEITASNNSSSGNNAGSVGFVYTGGDPLPKTTSLEASTTPLTNNDPDYYQTYIRIHYKIQYDVGCEFYILICCCDLYCYDLLLFDSILNLIIFMTGNLNISCNIIDLFRSFIKLFMDSNNNNNHNIGSDGKKDKSIINNNNNDNNIEHIDNQNSVSGSSNSWSTCSTVSDNSFVLNYFDPIYAISDDQEYMDPYSPSLDQKLTFKFNENIHSLSSSSHVPIVSIVQTNNGSSNNQINDYQKQFKNVENNQTNFESIVDNNNNNHIHPNNIVLEKVKDNDSERKVIFTTPKYVYTQIALDNHQHSPEQHSLTINSVELIPDGTQKANLQYMHTPLPKSVYDNLQSNSEGNCPLKSVTIIQSPKSSVNVITSEPTNKQSTQPAHQHQHNNPLNQPQIIPIVNTVQTKEHLQHHSQTLKELPEYHELSPKKQVHIEPTQQNIQHPASKSTSLGIPFNSNKYRDLRKSTQYLDLKNMCSISKAQEEEIEMLSDERYEYQLTDDDPTQHNILEMKPGAMKESGVLFGTTAEEPIPTSPSTSVSTDVFDSTPLTSPISSPVFSSLTLSPELEINRQSPLATGETRIIAEVNDLGKFSPQTCTIEKDTKKEKKHFFQKKKKQAVPDKQKSCEEVLSDEGKHSMKVISELLNKLFGKKKYGTLTIFMGLALLHSYYKELLIRNYNCINNKMLMEEAFRYQKFCTASYGRKLYYGVMGSKTAMHLFKGIAGTDAINVKVVIKHTGIKKQDIVCSKWYSSKYSPGHFVAIDHQTKSVVLAIRGTFNHFDVITDLVAKTSRYAGPTGRWKSAHIHLGMLLCGHKKMKEVEAVLLKSLHENPGYRLVVTGHSLGAGVASIFTFLFYDAHPEIPIHCYSFGPPCILNYEAATNEIVKSLVTSFAMNDDIVPRLSFNSLFYLREVLDSVLSQSKTKIQRGFHIVSAGNGLGEKLTKKISKILKVSPTIDLSHVEHNPSGEMPMYPPGKLVRMVKVAKGQYVAESVETSSFDKIIVSVQMFTDHMPNKYEKGLKSAIENVGNAKLLTPPQGANLVEGLPAGEENAINIPEMILPKDAQPQAAASLIPTSLKASYNTMAEAPQN